jgi:hypothetical protein
MSRIEQTFGKLLKKFLLAIAHELVVFLSSSLIVACGSPAGIIRKK